MSTNTILRNPVTTKVTLPASVSPAGHTVDSDGVSVTITAGDADARYGSITRELERTGVLKRGMYLYDSSQNEMREIVGISYKDDHFTIASPFTADLSGANLEIIPRSDLQEISLTGISGTATVYDADDNASDLVTGQTVTWNKDDKNRGENGFTGPLIVDATGASVSIQTRR